MAFASRRAQVRTLLRDHQRVWTGSDTALQALIDRGSRDIGRRGQVLQTRRTFTLPANTAVVTLPIDHVQTFTFFRGDFTASIRLLSQDGHAWWLQTANGDPQLTDAQPSGAILLGTQNISWLEILSPDAFRWYVFPSITGDIEVSDTQPAVGTGTTQTGQLRDHDGFPWYPAVTNAGLFRLTSLGTATLMAPPIDDEALQEVVPEAIERIDPRVSTGPPMRYAVSGTQVQFHPVPTSATQLRHLYWSDDPVVLPRALEFPPVLFAAALLLQQRRRYGPAAQLHTLAEHWGGLVAQHLSAHARDGATMYHMPPGR